MDFDTLPFRLIRLRYWHAMSQADLARKSGVAAASLSRIERDAAVDPHLSTIVALCGVFDVSLDYLVPPKSGGCVELALWPCHGCGTSGPHCICDCIMRMHGQNRSLAFIAARMGLTLETVSMIVRGELALRERHPQA